MVDILDFCRVRSTSNLQPAPDGSALTADVIQPVLSANRYSKELWLLQKSQAPRRLLADGVYAGSFFWLDAHRGAALESVGQNTSTIVELRMPEGAALARRTIPAAATGLYPLPDGRYAYTAIVNLRKEDYPEGLSFLGEMDDAWDIIDEIPLWNDGKGFSSQLRQSLFVLEADGSARQITPPRRYVDAVRPTPDGLLYTARTYEASSVEPGLYRWIAASGETVCLVPERRYRIQTFCAAEDKVYFIAQDKRIHSMTDDPDFYFADESGVTKTALPSMGAGDTNSSDCVYGSGCDFAYRAGKLYFLHTDEHSSFLMEADPVEGTARALTPEGGSVSGFALTDTEIYITGMRGQGFSEAYLVENSALRPLSDFNAGVLEGQVQAPERMCFENNGFRVNYVVLKPANYDPSKKYPAILAIHGGAKVLYSELFFHEMQFLASRGYFVLYGNPRGSDGQGSEFANLREHYGEPDFADLMKAVDVALERYPAIDPERLGVEGGSYGGIMTNWCVTHTHRFKAAVAQRSICNMMSTFGTADNGFGFVREQMGGDLWNGADKLWRQSPLKYANQCTTPLLLIHSTGDHRCDYSEAIQMFTALRYLGVESRVCLIHGECHGLSRRGSPKQRVKRLYEMVRWFDIHLKKDEAQV